MLLFCKCHAKLIFHLTAEIQVALGSVVKLRMLNIENNLLKKANEELHAAAETVRGTSFTHLYLGRKLCRISKRLLFSVIKALNTIKLFYRRSQEATRPTQ